MEKQINTLNPPIQKSPFNFTNLPQLTQKLLASISINTLTPVQSLSLPKLHASNSLFIKAPTGTGKTFCYLLPLLDRLIKSPKTFQGFLIFPTKDLAFQAFTVFNTLLNAKKDNDYIITKKFKIAIFNGFHSTEEEMRILRKRPHIIFATPGRLLIHMRSTDIKEVKSKKEKKNNKNSKHKREKNKKKKEDNVCYGDVNPGFFVFDEADQLFGQSFRKDMIDLLGYFNFNKDEKEKKDKNDKKGKKTCFVFLSATCDEKIKIFLEELKFNFGFIDFYNENKENNEKKENDEICASGKLNIEENMFFSVKDKILLKFLFLFQKYIFKKKTIIFLNSKEKVEILFNFLIYIKEGNLDFISDKKLKVKKEFFSSNPIIKNNENDDSSNLKENKFENLKNLKISHLTGDMRNIERDNKLKGNWNVLISSDVAERGIDIDDVELIINFEIPKNETIYTHRIGRTGRVGKYGKVLNIVSEHSIRNFLRIEDRLEKNICELELEGFKNDGKMEESIGMSSNEVNGMWKGVVNELKKKE